MNDEGSSSKNGQNAVLCKTDSSGKVNGVKVNKQPSGEAWPLRRPPLRSSGAAGDRSQGRRMEINQEEEGKSRPRRPLAQNPQPRR